MTSIVVVSAMAAFCAVALSVAFCRDARVRRRRAESTADALLELFREYHGLDAAKVRGMLRVHRAGAR